MGNPLNLLWLLALVVIVLTIMAGAKSVPQGTIWTKSAPRWACHDPNLPQTEGQPTAKG